MGMPLLDFKNSVSLSTTHYTTTKKGVIVGCVRSANGSSVGVYVQQSDDTNYKLVGYSASDNHDNTVNVEGIPIGTQLWVSGSCSVYPLFVPYK